MAKGAVARETVFALRRQIAKIEGTLANRLEVPGGAQYAAHVDAGMGKDLLPTGVERLDAALGGGLQKAALTEIHGTEIRDAGAVSGFMLALASLLLAQGATAVPILWIGTGDIFRETGFPYPGGLLAMFGIEPEALLFCEAKKLVDALWIAEEAARTAPQAVILETHGNPKQLDLTATRRLHARVRETGRPLFLLRQAAEAQPTAAPLRLVVAPAASALRETVAGPLRGSIGRPAFTVSVGKSRTAVSGQFLLEWNPDERIFEERRVQKRWAADSRSVVSLSRHGADLAAAPGAVVAFRQDSEPQFAGPGAAGPHAVDHQPSGPERAAHLRPRRAG